MNNPSVQAATPKSQRNHTQTNAREAFKNEVIEGRAVQKAAANRRHNIIRTNFIVAIGSRIQRSTFEVYSGDMRVNVAPNSVLFPDVAVVGSEPAFTDPGSATLANPTAVVEIFSSASPSQDRTARLEGFLAIPSIKECLLVNENEMRVEHYARQQVKQWVYRIYNERDDVIVLDSLSVRISLSEVYSQVRFAEAELSSRTVN